MKKALIAVAALAAVAAAVPSHVQARNGGAVAAGVIGGLAVGAIVGGASRRSRATTTSRPMRIRARSMSRLPERASSIRKCGLNRHQAHIVRNVRVPC